MRLSLILPPVQPEVYPEVSGCPYAGCSGRHVQHWQTVPKPVRDTQVQQVLAQRYRCVRCGRTFRVYPAGVSHDQTSARLKGVAVMFYVLGMSYGAVATALSALGWPLSRVAVYYAVQEAGAAVVGLRRETVARGGGRIVALGADLTSVRCAGQWVTVGISVDAVQGTVLSLDLLPNAEAATLTAWVQQLAAVLGAELLVSDDADPFKTAADASGVSHQVCKSHVRRNTEAWVETITPALAGDADGSLAAIGVAPEQAVVDCQDLLRLMTERQPSAEASATLAAIHYRYLAATKPPPGGTMSLAYRLRLFSLDRWNLWPRLTRYRTWAGPDGEQVDGTNNACERAIGWWVKERYRSMRGYKRPESVLHVSRLIAAMGNALDGPGFALAEVIT
jgi:transposase-like protein